MKDKVIENETIKFDNNLNIVDSTKTFLNYTTLFELLKEEDINNINEFIKTKKECYEDIIIINNNIYFININRRNEIFNLILNIILDKTINKSNIIVYNKIKHEIIYNNNKYEINKLINYLCINEYTNFIDALNKDTNETIKIKTNDNIFYNVNIINNKYYSLCTFIKENINLYNKYKVVKDIITNNYLALLLDFNENIVQIIIKNSQLNIKIDNIEMLYNYLNDKTNNELLYLYLKTNYLQDEYNKGNNKLSFITKEEDINKTKYYNNIFYTVKGKTIYYIKDETHKVLLNNTLNQILNKQYDYISLLNLKNKTINIFDKQYNNNNLIIRNNNYHKYMKNYKNILLDKDNKIFNISLKEIIKKIKAKDKWIITVKNTNDEEYKRLRFYKVKNDNKLILTCTDVTKIVVEEMKQKEALRLAKQKAEEATKAKRQFLSQISHDIRTPMNAIMGLITLSLKENLNEKAEENLKMAYDSSEYLFNLISNTLNMNNIEENVMNFEKETFNLYDQINSITSTVINQMQNKNLSFELIFDCDKEISINTDIGKLSQIIVNLLSNAIKYTKAYGKVTLKVEGVKKYNYLDCYIKISDTGIGISEEFLPKIFNRYERENRTFNAKGTGIGLYIVKSFVDFLKGKIEVSSIIDKGTTFTLHFKFNVINEIENKQIIDYNFEGLKVLLVDDDILNIKVGKSFLQLKGIIVDTASNGLEAVNKLLKEKYDLVLMDIRMPVLDGYKATEKIRLFNENIPIIAMSANAFDDDIKKSIESGMNDHISKPIKMDKLYNIIIRHISS